MNGTDVRSIAVLGYITLDIVVRAAISHLPADVSTGHIEMSVGGSGANVASWLAFAGHRSIFVGVAGADSAGRQAIESLEQLGVDMMFTHRQGRTPHVLSLVDSEDSGAEHQLVVDNGGPFLDCDLRMPSLHDVSVAHIPAFLLYREDLRAQTVNALRALHDATVPFTVDVSSSSRLAEFGVAQFRRLLAEMAPMFLLMNADEYDVLTESGCKRITECPYIVHRGSRPTLIRTATDHFAVEVGDNVIKVIDSTGAGDAFTAGLLGALNTGLTLRAAVDSAHKWAGQAISQMGAQPVVAYTRPTASEGHT